MLLFNPFTTELKSDPKPLKSIGAFPLNCPWIKLLMQKARNRSSFICIHCTCKNKGPPSCKQVKTKKLDLAEATVNSVHVESH